MKTYTTIVLFLLSFFSPFLYSQLISEFKWDIIGQDPKIADVGPDATSISSSAIISANGAHGTNGLNAGINPKRDIEMVFTNDPLFDVEGIDLSVDYQRDENVGTFFKRGSNFTFLSANQLFVNFKLKDPTNPQGGITVSSGNRFDIPLDDIFRNYRFKYDPNTGIAELFVDGVQKWSKSYTPGLFLDWTNAGDIMIGFEMDGNGDNKTIYDNYKFHKIRFSPLPIELKSMAVIPNEKEALIDVNWTTASETNNDYFTVERSVDGIDWKVIGKINGAGNSNLELNYSFQDIRPVNGLSYYRLKQTDFDGQFTYSPIKSVECSINYDFELFPNPLQQGETIHFDNLAPHNSASEILIYSLSGMLIKRIQIQTFQEKVNLPIEMKPGIYFVVFEEVRKKLVVKS